MGGCETREKGEEGRGWRSYLLDILEATDIETTVSHHHVEHRAIGLAAHELAQLADVVGLVEITVVLRGEGWGQVG